MAVRTRVEIIDDLDETPDASPVTFAFDGVDYEIDLTDENRERLQSALEPYINSARKVKSSRRKPRKPKAAKSTPVVPAATVEPEKKGTGKQKPGRKLHALEGGGGAELDVPDVDSKVVRAWAEANDVEVPSRGRIPMSVLRQYHAAKEQDQDQDQGQTRAREA